MANMVATTPLNIEAVNLDDEREVDAFHEAWITTGQAKVQDDFLRLRELGIVDCVLSAPDPKTVPFWNLPEAELRKRIGPGEG